MPGLQVLYSLCCLGTPSLAVSLSGAGASQRGLSVVSATQDAELLLPPSALPQTDVLPPWELSRAEVPRTNVFMGKNESSLGKNQSSLSKNQSSRDSVSSKEGSVESRVDVPMEKVGASTMTELMKTYDASQPPPVNEDGRLQVAFAFRANQLLEFDHVEQTLKVVGWVRMYWYDPRLAYEGTAALKGAAADQGWDSGKDFLTVPAEKIWKPDITLYNAVDINWGELCAPSKAYIADQVGGLTNTEQDSPMRWNVFWSQPCVLHSRCAAQLKWYPFDNNTCSLEFSPFADNFVQMHIAKDMIDSAISVPEFEVSVSKNDITLEKDPYTIVGKPVPWDMLTIRMRLLRHGQYYVINYIGPIMLLIALTWVGFWIPPGASDRVAYNITLLLTLMAVNFITADKRPATHEDMWLDRFQTATVLMVVGATFYSAFLMHMQPPDNWPEEKKEAQLSRLEFREKWARILFPVVGGGYLGFLFWQLQKETHIETYSFTAYLIFLALGIVGLGLCANACGAEKVVEQLRGQNSEAENPEA